MGEADTSRTEWRMFLPPSVLYQRIFGENSVPSSAALWSRATSAAATGDSQGGPAR